MAKASLTMFHYTSSEGYLGILKTKQIWPSLKANNTKDARYGEGQYVSDIVPGSKRPGQLSMIFLRIPWAGKRFTHFVGINVRGLEVIYGRPNVFLIKNASPLHVSGRLVSQGVN